MRRILIVRAAKRVSYLAVALGLPVLLLACPPKDKGQPDAGPPDTGPPDTGPIALVPMEDAAADAPPEADADAEAGKKFVGNTNVLRLKQCCAALGAEAKRLGPSPEAGLFTSAAAQCNAMASQVAPGGNAPELGALRAVLAGRTVPPVCAGF